jgi:HAD superfamily hydrolase (TIGR01484 family)
MKETIALGLFDLDGTLVNKDKFSSTTINGLEHFRRPSRHTSITTGKSYKQILNRHKSNLEVMVSQNMPMSLENGGRLVNMEGRNLTYHPLLNDEINMARDAVANPQNNIAAICYQPEDPLTNMVAWSPNKIDLSRMLYPDEQVIDIVETSEGRFFQRVSQDKPCMLIIVANDDSDNLSLPEGLNVVTNEGVVNITSMGINKGLSLIELSELVNIPLPDILVAGNDKNDYPLMKSDAGIKIWIGANIPDDLQLHEITNLKTIEELGKYLQYF